MSATSGESVPLTERDPHVERPTFEERLKENLLEAIDAAVSATCEQTWLGQRLMYAACIHRQPLTERCGTCEHEAAMTEIEP